MKSSKVLEKDQSSSNGKVKSRNEYPTQLRTVSASTEFWEAIEQYAQERGLTRSGAVVELVRCGIGKKAPPASKGVGRPRKRTVKKVSN